MPCVNGKQGPQHFSYSPSPPPIHCSRKLQLHSKALQPFTYTSLTFLWSSLLLIFTQVSIGKPKCVPSEGSTDLGGLKEVNTVKLGCLGPP